MPAFVPALLEHGPGHLLHISTRRAAVGWGVARVGCPVYTPAKAPPSAVRRRRTPHSSRVSHAIRQRAIRIKPVPCSSRAHYRGGNANSCWPPAASPLAEGLAALGHHRLPQREAVSTVVHCLASPTQLLEGGGYGCLGDDRCPPAIPLDPPGGGPRPGARAQGARAPGPQGPAQPAWPR